MQVNISSGKYNIMESNQVFLSKKKFRKPAIQSLWMEKKCIMWILMHR